ncbi:phenylalanyl-tRNA synthetase beta subunit [Coriobacterium glomerans PW2]|uniref:Phenylalanine--tRNA ligase beta subunit n=1 Tax=Coriobacterium glomerans (strain ATCC 49209 / DSM 20642 / JCM 10262 / PW2) TaxID=700015 RepID=F2N8Y6_CORGP|nr:phenylalanine--tRNA ligase subunit beta [Coriobacterium glomerans]AEB07586.1 phenylalanyl-tRNA synthetase beta subunit [Coriobacterium glomerans PW2]
MRVSYAWLKTMVDLPTDPYELAERLNRTGTEVETVETVGENLENVVTARVVTKVPHPDSDHMWVTMIDVGADEPIQIVCGAQNFNEGDHIVTALIGAELPGGIRIKKSKLRGVESRGMNCSAAELGLGADHDGIMILPPDAPVGVPFSRYRGTSDTVLDCEITPNRPDCLSMIGMAREVGAVLDRELRIDAPSISREAGRPTAEEIALDIEGEGLCSRYVARVIRGVSVGPSPEWMVQRLAAAGVRSINNVVDITNYVMMLTGQPLHAFDLEAFAAHDGHRQISVRAARPREVFRTLDGQDRTLSEGMVLITDGERPVALAGVMGGMDSEIESDTTSVLVESACFDAARTSHTSRDLSLISDASIRFERQVDEAGCLDVANIACALIEQIAGGTVAPGFVEHYPAPKVQSEVELRIARLRKIVGAPIEAAFAEHALIRLGCELIGSADAAEHVGRIAAEAAGPAAEGADRPLRFKIPTFRPDLTREIDLIEEVLRLWGTERVPSRIPAAENHIGGLTREQRTRRRVGSILRACGLSETRSLSFAAPDDLARIGMSTAGRGLPVVLMNPLVHDQTEMRRSLLPSLLHQVAYNLAHGTADVALYETGTLFFGRESASLPRERASVAGVLTGASGYDSWLDHPKPARFFDGKGVVEELLAQLRIEKVRFRVPEGDTAAHLQSGRAAEVLSGGAVLGWVGEISPVALEALDIDQPVVAFELNLDALVDGARDAGSFRAHSSYPAVEVDLAIVVDENVSCEDLERRLMSAGGRLLRGIRLFDVYRDEARVGAGRKSMAFSLTYQADDHTLTSQEVDKAHQRLVKKVTASTGGEVRS